jgi:hypothetical protein
MLHDAMVDPIAPKQPQFTSVPRERRIILVIRKEMLIRTVPNADKRVNYTKQQAKPAGKLNEREGPSECDCQWSRQYI